MLADLLRDRVEVLRHSVSTLPLKESIDAFLDSVLEVALELRPGRSEPGAAVEVNDPAKIPVRLLIGRVSRPQTFRIPVVHWGIHDQALRLESMLSSFRETHCLSGKVVELPPTMTSSHGFGIRRKEGK